MYKYILSLLLTFLNTPREDFYRGVKEYVRKCFNIPDGQTLYLNGYYPKPIIYINADNCLETTEIPIRRLLWIKGDNERVHIYVSPSFILKYCPFPLDDIERVHVEFLSWGIEPFNVLKDPLGLLDSSIPYETWAARLASILKKNDFQAQWSKLYYDTFYALPDVKSSPDFLSQCLDMVRTFLKKLNTRKSTGLQEYNLLSYGNFQLPFR